MIHSAKHVTTGAKSDRRQRNVIRKRHRDAALLYRWFVKEVPSTVIPIVSLHDLDRLTRQRQLSASKGWLGAKKRVEGRMLTILASISLQAEDAIAALHPTQPSPRISIAEIANDLAALVADFATTDVGRRGRMVSVTTEPIELDGVYLGSFTIELDLRELDQSCPYRVIAKDPHPAATSDGTTHPHVCDERLCEGEGQSAIKRALSDGRLYDFFVIVRQILQTYNPGSAYISLEDWHGIECRDCGDTVDASDSDNCSRCDARTCRSCNCVCGGCEEVYCDECTSLCEGCDSRFCSGCLKRCDRCEESFCDQCMKGDLCDDCLEEKKAEEEAAEAEVHSVRLGETAVPS